MNLIGIINEEIKNFKQPNLNDDLLKWFNGSKVIDENGKPLLVFHGGSSSMIKNFKPSRDGIFFTDNIDVAEQFSGVKSLNKPKYSKKIVDILNSDYDNINDLWKLLQNNGFKIERKREYDEYGQPKWYIIITDTNGYEHKLSDYVRTQDVKQEVIKRGLNYAAYLKIINPFIFNSKGNNWDNLLFNGKIVSTMHISLYAKENNFDGVIFKDLYEMGVKSNVYVVYNNDQIKVIN